MLCMGFDSMEMLQRRGSVPREVPRHTNVISAVIRQWRLTKDPTWTFGNDGRKRQGSKRKLSS